MQPCFLHLQSPGAGLIPIPVSLRGFQVFWEVRDVGLFNATTLGLCRCAQEWLVGWLANATGVYSLIC